MNSKLCPAARPLSASAALQSWTLSHMLPSHSWWQLVSQSPVGATLGGTGAASQRSRREQAASFKQENLNSCPANHPPERELSDQRLLILECDFVSKKLSRLKQ